MTNKLKTEYPCYVTPWLVILPNLSIYAKGNFAKHVECHFKSAIQLRSMNQLNAFFLNKP